MSKSTMRCGEEKGETNEFFRKRPSSLIGLWRKELVCLRKRQRKDWVARNGCSYGERGK